MDVINQLIWDETDALKRVMGKEQILNILVDSFLETMPSYAQQLADDLTKKDIQSAAISAHTLKGAAANLSVLVLADISKRIEQACRERASLDEVLTLHTYFKDIFQKSCEVLSTWKDTRKSL
jgi:HPt (histidine-containing phosphotransfer) domain-containing protein